MDFCNIYDESRTKAIVIYFESMEVVVGGEKVKSVFLEKPFGGTMQFRLNQKIKNKTNCFDVWVNDG